MLAVPGLPVSAELADVISRELVAAHGRVVAGKVDDHACDLTVWRFRGEHADVGVDGSGGSDDVLVVGRAGFTGVRDFAAVAHQKAAVERNGSLGADADAQLGCMEAVPRARHCRDDFLGDLVEVCRVGVAAKARGNRAARVCVAGANEHIFAGDRRRFLDGPPRRFDCRTRNEQGVDAHECDRRLAVVSHAGDSE